MPSKFSISLVPRRISHRLRRRAARTELGVRKRNIRGVQDSVETGRGRGGGMEAGGPGSSEAVLGLHPRFHI